MTLNDLLKLSRGDNKGKTAVVAVPLRLVFDLDCHPGMTNIVHFRNCVAENALDWILAATGDGNNAGELADVVDLEGIEVLDLRDDAGE